MPEQRNMLEKKRSLSSVWLRVLATFLCSVVVSSEAAAASAFAPDACDPDYYKSMKSRAWLEAQREITQNQNLIFKPDSVLEYTCFDKFLGVLAHNSSNMFSESTRWGLAAGNLQTALTPLIAAPLSAYENANFNHTALGGRMAAGTSYTIPATITPTANYTCQNMRIVWMAAKCMNFIENSAEDGFFTFAEYAADPDKRFLPDRCPGIGSQYTSNLNTALVEGQTPWKSDKLTTRLSYIYPAGTGTNVCGGSDSKIKTGLVVHQSIGSVNKYNEYICLVPGCHYTPTAEDAGNCSQS